MGQQKLDSFTAPISPPLLAFYFYFYFSRCKNAQQQPVGETLITVRQSLWGISVGRGEVSSRKSKSDPYLMR
jgi:hypothetical protein